MGQDKDYLGAIIEDVDDRFHLLLELFDTLKDVPADIKILKEDLAETKMMVNKVVAG